MKTTRSLTLFLALALLGFVFLALSAPTARAADPVIVRVKVNGLTSGSCGNLTDWSNACGLQHALKDVASSGTQLWVAAGTYTPTTDLDRTATFKLRDGIALLGGFAGTETAVNQRNTLANVTILSGDLNGNDTSSMDWNEPTRSDNSYHVVTGSGVGNTAMLDGFTVKGGHANNPTPPNDRGGGMYNEGGGATLASVTFSSNWAYAGGGMHSSNGSPTMTYVTFSGNKVAFYGGGMYNWSSSPTLTNVTFDGNSSTNGNGGAMYNGSSSTPTLTNVFFSGNSATNGNGGGIYNFGNSSPTLLNVSFISNTAKYGGGMHDEGGVPTLANVTFSANSAGQHGGGMYNSSSNPLLTYVTFNGNSASEHGGGMFNVSSSPLLTYVTFNGNSASVGGGMRNEGGSPAVTNVTFMMNSASYGGGVHNGSSIPILTNLTFYGNNASSHGGGMYNASSSPTLKNVTLSGNSATSGGGAMANVVSSNPTIRNSILWANTAPSNPQIFNDTSAPSLYDNVVQGGYAGGTHIINADPRLGPLGNWGSSTKTLPLLHGSSAIDAGDDATCAPTDQRGVTRPVGLACDMGAFEGVLYLVDLPLIRK